MLIFFLILEPIENVPVVENNPLIHSVNNYSTPVLHCDIWQNKYESQKFNNTTVIVQHETYT